MSFSLGHSRLEALLESAQLLHSSLNLQDLLSHLLRSVMGRLLVTKAFIAVSEDGCMRLAQVRGLPKLKIGDAYHESEVRENGIRIILPVGDENSPVGFLGISQPIQKDADSDELEFLRALLGLAAGGIENAKAHSKANKLNEELDQKIQELKTLLDLVRGLTSSLEPDEVAQLLMLTLSGRWMVRKYALIAWKSGHPPVLRFKGMNPDLLAEFSSYKNTIEDLPDSMKVSDLPESSLKNMLMEESAEVLFPIKAGDRTTGGIVAIGGRPGNLSYSESDLDFGTGLVAQAAVAFENAWHVREAIERKKVEQELALAATIQENLFPSSLPKLPNYEFSARNRPARQCGGDYYDILPVGGVGSEGTFLVCVADVSGKGLPASLLMSNIQATLRALVGRVHSLTELSAHTNELLFAVTPSNKYVTAIMLDIDINTGKVRFVNAGHTSCLLLRADGEAVWLCATGTPLGMLPGMSYEEQSFELLPGDLIALFSDGVTEAQDEDENEYSEERVAEFIRTIAGEPLDNIVDKVFEEIDRFAGSAPQYDDITLFIIKRKA